MNKTELIGKVANRAGVSFALAEECVNAFLDVVCNALQEGDSVQLFGFGVFQVKERAARAGRNPKTGESLEIEAKKSPVFKAGKPLKDFINN